MHWGHLALAVVLFVAGGVLIASASYDGDVLACVTGVFAILLGALIVVGATPRWRSFRGGRRSTTVWDPAAAPRLGDMLLTRRLISETQLDQALSLQRSSGTRLGQVLVDMGVVSHAQVADVLEEQLSRRSWRSTDGSRAERA